MNKYLMKTIIYKDWKINIYQWLGFAGKRFEVICQSPNGRNLDYSKISLRCWFKEEFAIEDAQEFIDLVIKQQSTNSISGVNWEFFDLPKTNLMDFSVLISSSLLG